MQNVAHSPLLKSKRSAAWLHINASTIVFSAGGPLYPKGADSYLDHLLQVLSPSLLCKSTPSIVSMIIWAIHRLCLLLPSSPSNEQMTHTDRTSCHERICESCEQPLGPTNQRGYLHISGIFDCPGYRNDTKTYAWNTACVYLNV